VQGKHLSLQKTILISGARIKEIFGLFTGWDSYLSNTG